jgi:hypothetical protein
MTESEAAYKDKYGWVSRLSFNHDLLDSSSLRANAGGKEPKATVVKPGLQFHDSGLSSSSKACRAFLAYGLRAFDREIWRNLRRRGAETSGTGKELWPWGGGRGVRAVDVPATSTSTTQRVPPLPRACSPSACAALQSL